MKRHRLMRALLEAWVLCVTQASRVMASLIVRPGDRKASGSRFRVVSLSCYLDGIDIGIFPAS